MIVLSISITEYGDSDPSILVYVYTSMCYVYMCRSMYKSIRCVRFNSAHRCVCVHVQAPHLRDVDSNSIDEGESGVWIHWGREEML